MSSSDYLKKNISDFQSAITDLQKQLHESATRDAESSGLADKIDLAIDTILRFPDKKFPRDGSLFRQLHRVTVMADENQENLPITSQKLKASYAKIAGRVFQILLDSGNIEEFCAKNPILGPQILLQETLRQADGWADQLSDLLKTTLINQSINASISAAYLHDEESAAQLSDLTMALIDRGFEPSAEAKAELCRACITQPSLYQALAPLWGQIDEWSSVLSAEDVISYLPDYYVYEEQKSGEWKEMVLKLLTVALSEDANLVLEDSERQEKLLDWFVQAGQLAQIPEVSRAAGRFGVGHAFDKLAFHLLLDKANLPRAEQLTTEQGRVKGFQSIHTSTTLARGFQLFSETESFQELGRKEQKLVSNIEAMLRAQMEMARLSSKRMYREKGELLAEKLQEMEDGDLILCPTGKIGHATLLAFEKLADGSMNVTLYNTGSGISDYHHKSKVLQRFQTYYRVENIPFGQLLERDWPSDLEAMHSAKDMAATYQILGQLEQLGNRESPPEDEAHWEKQQQSGTCTAACYMAFIRDFLVRNGESPSEGLALYKQVKAGMLTAWTMANLDNLQDQEIKDASEEKLKTLGAELSITKIIQNGDYPTAAPAIAAQLEQLETVEKYSELVAKLKDEQEPSFAMQYHLLHKGYRLLAAEKTIDSTIPLDSPPLEPAATFYNYLTYKQENFKIAEPLIFEKKLTKLSNDPNKFAKLLLSRFVLTEQPILIIETASRLLLEKDRNTSMKLLSAVASLFWSNKVSQELRDKAAPGLFMLRDSLLNAPEDQKETGKLLVKHLRAMLKTPKTSGSQKKKSG